MSKQIIVMDASYKKAIEDVKSKLNPKHVFKLKLEKEDNTKFISLIKAYPPKLIILGDIHADDEWSEISLIY